MLKKALLVTALMIGLCAPLLGTRGTALAVLECCPWPYNSSQNVNLNISYLNYGDTYLAPMIDNAANQWSSQLAPPTLIKNCPPGCVGTTTVSAGSPQCGWCGGWTSFSGNPRTSSSIVMNESYLKASSSVIAQALVDHEFGHAIGLWHADGTGCHSVMWSYLGGNNPYTTSPSGYDVSEENRMYPNPWWHTTSAC